MVVENPQASRQRINIVSGDEFSDYGLLTVRENLWMFSQFYGLPLGEANQRIKHMLELGGLADRINTKSSDLSTGLRQKIKKYARQPGNRIYHLTFRIDTSSQGSQAG